MRGANFILSFLFYLFIRNRASIKKDEDSTITAQAHVVLQPIFKTFNILCSWVSRFEPMRRHGLQLICLAWAKWFQFCNVCLMSCLNIKKDEECTRA